MLCELGPAPRCTSARIPPQKELTPTPRVTHLPAPLPRTHTALTLLQPAPRPGRQPGTGQGAAPAPSRWRKFPAALGPCAPHRGHPLPASPAPRAEASAGPSPSRRPGAGRWVLAAGRGRPWPSQEGACARRERGCHRRAGLGAACHGLPRSRPPALHMHVPLCPQRQPRHRRAAPGPTVPRPGQGGWHGEPGHQQPGTKGCARHDLGKGLADGPGHPASLGVLHKPGRGTHGAQLPAARPHTPCSAPCSAAWGRLRVLAMPP